MEEDSISLTSSRSQLSKSKSKSTKEEASS